MNVPNSAMNFCKNRAVLASVTFPSSVTTPGVTWMYASGVVICGELQ